MQTESTWHTLTIEEVARRIETDMRGGLSHAEARLRLDRDGPNELKRVAGRSPWRLLAEQFSGLLVIILIAAAVVSALLGDLKDAIAIAAIVLLNAALGFRQEYGAERAMAALRGLAAPTVRVRRGGNVREIPGPELVRGDVILIEAGNLIPADARLVECARLRVQESALTGESLPVAKRIEPLSDTGLAVGDRANMVHMGTLVTYGRGEAVVTATATATELGRIATLLESTEDEPSPLTVKIDALGHTLVKAALGLIAVVAILKLLRGDEWKLVFLTAISMAVAAVPEGLPAVVTIALSLGAKRMLGRRALIRRLPAVETLGSVTAICTDKTGTLTRNEMTVTVMRLPGREVDLTAAVADIDDAGRLCLGAAALCNDAVWNPDATSTPVGDPTETALVVAAAKAGVSKDRLAAALPRVAEVPFDSFRKRMATMHRRSERDAADPFIADFIKTCGSGAQNAGVVFCKGALDAVLASATRIRTGDVVEPLTDEWRKKLTEWNDKLAGDGIRVLGIAYRPLVGDAVSESPEAIERELIVLGLVGMLDPLREDVKAAVADCRGAGIRPIMITGDHPLMAGSIGRELGMNDGEGVLTGREVSGLSDEALREAVGRVSVFARVSPEDKLRIVDALQARGEIVAMTGDGVNDAPALKSADIGVAMGKAGTDVAREASDMVLLDDRYATIVAAIEEGRTIFDNIRRFVRFLLASNVGELLVMLLGPLFGLPLPLLPVQILWMNLVTDGLPALALGVEGAERDVMTRPPRRPSAPIVGMDMVVHIVWVGSLMAGLSLAVGLAGSRVGCPEWQTMLFTTMVLAQLFLALAERSEKETIVRKGLWGNGPLWAALAVTVVLQLAVVYVPCLQGFFRTTALTGAQLMQCTGYASLMLFVVESVKIVSSNLKLGGA